MIIETGIPNVVDPLAGSYYIEELTNQIKDKSIKLINEIHKMGGAISAIENNFQQNKIADSAYAYQQSIENNEQIIVCLNKFKNNEKHSDAILSIDEESIKNQLKKLKAFKAKRDAKKIKKHLDSLNSAIIKNENLIPSIIACIENHCTLGEICETMKNQYGEYI